VSRGRTRSLHLTGPLIVWLAMQLAVLAIGAGGVALSGGWPRPPEQFALDEMLIAQLVFTAMLFPYLLASLWSAVAIILTALPMLQIAGFLSVTPMDRLGVVAGFVALWMIALALWQIALPLRWQLPGAALAMLYTLGGGVIWYLQKDFSTPAHRSIFPPLMTPLPAALAVLHGDIHNLQPWYTLLMPLAAGAIAALTALLVGAHPRQHSERATSY
jgi:hypothetical protein